MICISTKLNIERIPRISKTAIAKYAEVKVQIAKGLKHAMEQLDKMEIRIDLKSSCVFIPQGGFYKK